MTNAIIQTALDGILKDVSGRYFERTVKISATSESNDYYEKGIDWDKVATTVELMHIFKGNLFVVSYRPDSEEVEGEAYLADRYITIRISEKNYKELKAVLDRNSFEK